MQKQFKQASHAYHSPEQELCNLSTLKLLNDPNIVELLGSYTYRGKHHFLFPLASGGDLARLLMSEHRPPELLSDEAFFHALRGLSVALEKVHNFTYNTLNLEMIGCHFDLRPRNILVHGGTFLLADFGLSRFKSAMETSKTQFRIGGDYYVAPECQDFDGEFQKHMISRPSDIWSYGCIIAEIVSYMIGGAKFVDEFQKLREIKIGNFKTYHFHAGPDKPNKGVSSWLDRLEEEATKPGQALIHLIRKMLFLDPERRPKAKDVTVQLTFIALCEVIQSTSDLLEQLTQRDDSYGMIMEGERFKCCAWALGVIDFTDGSITSECANKHGPVNIQLDYTEILANVMTVRQEIQATLLEERNILPYRILQLRHVNDQFFASLPLAFRRRAMTRLDMLMTKSTDPDVLENTTRAFMDTPLYRRIALLTAIVRASLLVTETSKPFSSISTLDAESMLYTGAIGAHSLAHVKLPLAKAETPVIVEWLYYDSEFSEELFVRVEAIADLLSKEKPTEFLGLDCRGLFHDQSKPAFGLLFPYPPSPIQPTRNTVPITLAKIMIDSKNSRLRPPLGDRFRLAYRLAVSALEFHKVGWLHKALTPFNIVFFQNATDMSTSALSGVSISKPFVLGFSQSRPNEPNALTKGPAENQHEEYHHPCYVEQGPPYISRYDYYSLGMILLEIGLWQSISNMRRDLKARSLVELRREFLTRRVPLLGHAMGERYVEAVKYCLDERSDCMNDSESLHLEFEKEVVERLAGCSA